MEIIDLRSDTVTKPTSAMREAMAAAELGDDVYGEDPSVNRLQDIAAEITGKDAALFVPSGTMGNLAAVLAYCQRGEEVILGHLAHTFLYEAGGIAALGGVQPYTVPNQSDGTLDLDDIRAAIRSDDAHFPVTRLIALESTHNRCGGVALSLEYMLSVKKLAEERGLLVHLDGARMFNAAVSLGCSAADIAAQVDSVTFCLSKGLSAPVGSLLCGSQEFIRKAHRIRKQVGGGMRQAGVLAAAGIVALEQMVKRLADDHARAESLAALLDQLDGLHVYAQNTNMVYIELAADVSMDEPSLLKALEEGGIKLGWVGPRRFRLVTHNDIDNANIEKAAAVFSDILT
ncbi:MAG: low-specificity L-threonine aldolase [Anaerolineae bacterium]|nr:low-specificity L-threonine aldolase [Anaerolineae bacterium]